MLLSILPILMVQLDPFAPRPVAFSHLPPPNTESVAVVGSFNNWDRAACPLVLQEDGKTWKGAFKIAPGVYPYLFVENGSKWVPDPKAPPFPDANGNTNSKLVVEPADYDLHPGKPADPFITRSALRHRLTREDAARLDRTTAYVKLRTRRNDVATVELLTPAGNSAKMERVAQDELFDTWRGELKLDPNKPTCYAFQLRAGTKSFLLTPKGLEESVENRANPKSKIQNPKFPFFSQPFHTFPLPNPPSWVQDAIFYQIFPERFANGNAKNDGPSVEPWGSKPTGKNRMGGDLAGIRKQLDYLHELGITALYLNPVFESLSNHGYDTVDYDQVDKRFGTNSELKALIAELDGKGIKTILDAVFNHSSPDFAPFKDVREKGQASSYKDWFFITEYPVEVKEGQKSYRTFAGVPTMPKLNQDNPACRNYFLGIGEKWLKEFGAAGWRLDVADEVSQDFWRAFRKRVKAADPHAYIVGEAWGDAHEYLQGDQHDAVMNYRWRKAVLDFLAYRTIDAAAFDKELRTIRKDYPTAILTSMFNLLGSHDTERLRTIFKGDSNRESLAVVLQFTYPGVPSIYYGDELGMEGGKDPDCRRCMDFDRGRDSAIFKLHKDLVALRKSKEALRQGSFQTLNATGDLFYFERRKGSSRIQTVLNASTKPSEIALKSQARLLLGRGASQMGNKLILKPLGFAIFEPNN